MLTSMFATLQLVPSLSSPLRRYPHAPPFLKAVCHSKKSWQAFHTGIDIVQQIAIMMGCAVLPHLCNLISCIAHGLINEQQKVQTMTALAIVAVLAEAAVPYGIESFNEVLKPLWLGIRQHRGKGLATFLKAIGFVIPLVDLEYTLYYTKEVTVILIQEFQMSDEEMKKTVLKVVKQCAVTEGESLLGTLSRTSILTSSNCSGFVAWPWTDGTTSKWLRRLSNWLGNLGSRRLWGE